MPNTQQTSYAGHGCRYVKGVVGGQLAISEMNFTLTRRMFSSE